MRLPLTRSSRWSGSVMMLIRPVMAVVDATARVWPCASLMLTVLALAAGVSVHVGQHGRLPLTWIVFAPVLSAMDRPRPIR